MFKLVFLVNPKSGGGKGAEIAQSLPEILYSFGFEPSDWCLAEMDYLNFNSQVQNLLRCSKRLIAIGGDGTMSSVLAAYVRGEFQHVDLGLIPLGTGNDLSRAMGIYDNFSNKGLVNTLRKLILGNSHYFDLWTVGDHATMAAYISMGFDAKVATQFHHDRNSGKIPYKSAWFNKIWYMWVGIQSLQSRIQDGATILFYDQNNQELSLPLSGKRMVLIGNVSSYAGGAKPFLETDFADGQLEILTLDRMWHFLLMMLTSTLNYKWYHNWLNKIIKPYQAKSAKIIIPKNEYIQIDGEPLDPIDQEQLLEIKYLGQAKIIAL